ncbi:hypothetical protein DTL21_05360 [Bremerella cremea]|uniref:Thioredoxin domain-containing protein n=1 Tax=Blastopirellula marina TaxID=124 RepID=A0A2S8FYV8_9BACT|nr:MULTISPECIES: M56 family metallopeptidase [Pirellulaceae]PQO37372.1 hypothetical protein C5Y83_05360 [Blastopirellula marina]RCS49759.1 hypothetical protein DTL21_05360 [Bremerella cremea]
MLFTLSAAIFALNLAIAAILCLGAGLLLAGRFTSLPKRYGTLSAGLIGSLIAPLAVAVGTWLSLGQLPTMNVASSSPSTDTVRTSNELGVAEDTQVKPLKVAESTSPINDTQHVVSSPPLATPMSAELPPAKLPQPVIEANPTQPITPEDTGSTTTASSPLSWIPLASAGLISCWLLGSVVMLCRYLLSTWRCCAFLRSCREVEDEAVQTLLADQCLQLNISKDVRLLESDSLPAPLVVAWPRPTIVLPTDINIELTSSQLRSVVAHELAHIKRRDHWTIVAQSASAMLYWWNPLVHWTAARMNALREMICDDIATSLTLRDQQQVKPSDYAASLLMMAERAVQYQQLAGSLGISLSSYSEMERRIRRILTERTRPVELRINKRFLAGLTALSLLLAVGLAFAQVPAEKPPADEPKAVADGAADKKEEQDEGESKEKEAKPKKTSKIEGIVIDQDDQPVSGAIVHMVSARFGQDEQVTTDAKGRYEAEMEISLGYRRIYATSPDGKQMGLYKPPGVVKEGEPETAKIRLEPIKTAQVKVVDSEGQPIEQAQIALQLGYPSMVGPATTNSEGIATVAFPESEPIQSAIAWKDHVGFDYKLYSLPYDQSGDQLTKKPEFPLDGIEQLQLTGVKPLTVHITDDKDTPLSDVSTHVWLLKKEQESEQLNFAYYIDMFTRDTDESGDVTFHWFPKWQKGITTVWPNAEGFVRTRGMYDPATQDGTLDIQLDRLIALRGKVTFPDGKPAEGIYVSANGAGYDYDNFRGSGKTDAKGRYEIMAAPNQIYLLYISGKEWSAAPQSGFVVLPGKEVPEHDFVLAPSTRVHGQVLNKATGEPVPGKLIYMTSHGISLNDLEEDLLPNPENSTRWVSPMRQYNMNSGEEGEFEFYVGEGDYNLFLSGHDAEKFTLKGEKEKHVDLKIEVQMKTKLIGEVIDDQSGETIGGAQVNAASRNFRQHNDWQAKTNRDGKFEVERLPEPTYLYVTDGLRMKGAIEEIQGDDTDVQVRLKQLGSATGQLMTEDGSQPAAGVKLHFGFTVYDVNDQMSSNRFGEVITTDKEGRFDMSMLVPGRDYVCTLFDNPGGYVLTVAKANVEPGQQLDLGQVKTPETPKPYVPPTLAERTQSAFEVQGTPLERLASGTKNIAIQNQNLLIVLAQPTDPRVETLMKIRYEDEDFNSYRDDFRFMAIPTDEPRIEAAQKLADKLELGSVNASNEFRLVILNRQGEVAGTITAEQVCEGDQLSKSRLLAALDPYRTKTVDARQLLDEALAQAARENKKVLVQETATWCGPCLRLSRLLLENPQWKKDYVWVKMDHRWTGAIDIMKEMRGEASGGVPWFAILDAEGNKLATSNMPESGDNIGFPSSDEGRQHFKNMLKATSTRMTDAEIDSLAGDVEAK